MSHKSPVQQYYFFGLKPSGRAEFVLLHVDGNVTMLSLNMAEVWDQLVSKGVQCVDLSRDGIARMDPPDGLPRKRW